MATARLDRFLSAIDARGASPALLHGDEIITYAALSARVADWRKRLASRGVEDGDVVGLQSDFTPDAIALLLALWSTPAVAALVPEVGAEQAVAIASARWVATDSGRGLELSETALPATPSHPLLVSLAERRSGGIVIFSSGSTGEPKAILHDVERFLAKFDRRGRAFRTLAFLLFDHIAGLDTLGYTLAHGGCLVLPEARDPDSITASIERHRVEVLPTSPTFLRFLCLSETARARDLSSIAIVTYGSEPMTDATLTLVTELFPSADIQQKYGTSEFGSPRSRSRSRDSLWIDLNDDALETRIVDGILWLRSETGMLGYLNADNPFDEEGWYCTGDRVLEEDGWLRILGRESEMINVGGEKVHPEEVEAVIATLPWVADVLVRGAPHPFTGQIVDAVVQRVATPGDDVPTDAREARRAVRARCRETLAPHKVPVLVSLSEETLSSPRAKKRRREEIV